MRLNLSKEWCMKMADLEGDHAISIGDPDKFYEMMIDTLSSERLKAECIAMRQLAMKKRRWRPIETAPKDGTHILAVLHREACEDMDGIERKAFSEVREIWYMDYIGFFGVNMPWHAGDPFDSHDGMAPEHMGEAVPIKWMPIP